MKTGRIGAVIVAAGRGERAGQPEQGPKQYRHIGGAPVIRHTLENFLAHPAIAEIAVAIHVDDDELFAQAAGALADRVIVVPGGATRQESTLLALLALQNKGLDAVLIHDGVRPFTNAALIDRVIAGLENGGGSLPALGVSDTLKQAGDDHIVTGTIPRHGLFAAQTPQGFAFDAILAAHQQAHTAGRSDFTDDAAIAEWAGIAVKIVEGSPNNVKLTWAKDIEMANTRLSAGLLPDVRTGNGYDVHAFTDGDHVVLCGVKIPHHKRLTGHSDADVGLHALTDALLATCGAGDIGSHFPPSDPRWKDAASHIFVEEALRIVRQKGGRIANIDITLIAEFPKIGPHRAAITANLSGMLGIATERVSIKASTNERLGFLGREEGIVALATASVVYPGSLPE